MPDQRKHRGPHPQDIACFSSDAATVLRDATGDLSWLLTRGYASQSALKLVGDRYGLALRQRQAVARCAGRDDRVASRRQREVTAHALWHQELWIDAFNVLTSLEAALSGGIILHARDGCYRDLASMHGTYRKVNETLPAVRILGELIAEWHIASCHWLLDRPVSNSGRLKTMLREMSQECGWSWHIELVPDPDAVLIRTNHIIASADSRILDHASRWFNLAKEAIQARVPNAWIVDLSC